MLRLSLALSLVTACGSFEDYGSGTQGECVDDHYVDENGEEVYCVDTWEPGDPPPVDPCLILPQLCSPPDDPCADGGCSPPPDQPPETCTPPATHPPTDVAQEVANRVAACFQINWSQVPFREQTDSNYSTANDGWALNLANWAAEKVGCTVSNLDYLFFGDSAGNQALQQVVTHLNQQAAQQNLTPHEKICSAMCASGRMLEFSMLSMLDVFNSLPNNAVQNGVGVCREFAQVGARLLTGMGFTANPVTNAGHLHAYVEVTSPEGGSFYLEPQTGHPDDCIFYNRH